jgi:hypothetical protein
MPTILFLFLFLLQILKPVVQGIPCGILAGGGVVGDGFEATPTPRLPGVNLTI